MKIYTLIINILALYLSISSSYTFADDNMNYGTIDAFYPEELRIVIDDISVYFDSRSNFIGYSGNRLTNLDTTKLKGKLVKFHMVPNGKESLLLLDLTLISESEFNQDKEQDQADEH